MERKSLTAADIEFYKDMNVLVGGLVSIVFGAPLLGVALGWAANKYFPTEAIKRDRAKTQHVMYAPTGTAAYFQTLNDTKGYSCEVQFQDGKKHNNSSLKIYPAVKNLGDCMRIAFTANQPRSLADRSISVELNANAAQNSIVGRGMCGYRDKSGKPFCFATNYTDKYFLEYK